MLSCRILIWLISVIQAFPRVAAKLDLGVAFAGLSTGGSGFAIALLISDVAMSRSRSRVAASGRGEMRRSHLSRTIRTVSLISRYSLAARRPGACVSTPSEYLPVATNGLGWRDADDGGERWWTMAVETFPTERVSDRATGVTVATSTCASGCWSRRALLLTGRTPMTFSRTAAPTRESKRGAILLPEYFAVLELAIFVFMIWCTWKV